MIKDFLKSDMKVPSLAFHSMNQCGNRIVIYGGINASDKICGDLYFIKLEGKSINCASYEKNKAMFPTPRHSHSADYDKTLEKLLIFGGFTAESQFVDQFCILDLKNFPTIVFQTIKSVLISNRCKHTSFLHKNRLYIYGGVGIHKVTKKIQILNDFYYIEYTDKDLLVKEVNSKSGIEMNGLLFKAIFLKDNEFAFFSNDMRKMFVYNIQTEIFSKVIVKFVPPPKRTNYTLNRLYDGRLIVFGGMDNEESFKECFILINFAYEQEVHYSWVTLDLFGIIEEATSGHATVVLENNNLLIHGGTKYPHDPIITKFIKSDNIKPDILLINPVATRRLKLLNIHESYYWSKKYYDVMKTNVKPRILHVAVKIPDKYDEDKIFIHGGEQDYRFLCNYSIYNMKTRRWLQYTTNDFIPQLKSHAACLITDLSKGDQYVILTGGLKKDHTTNCNAYSNEDKETCLCDLQSISDMIYAFKDQTFYKLKVTNKADIGEKLKRFGHSMICTNENIIYLLGGYMQYKGYIIQILRLIFTPNPKEKFTIIAEDINLKVTIPGRMFASMTYIFDRIVLFGGVCNNNTLNDFYLINLTKNHEVIVIDSYQKDHVYPRMGMSSEIVFDEVNPELARLIIFGGSYWTGNYLIEGMTNEVLNVEITRKKNTEDVTFDVKFPLVYCEVEKHIFHTANEYKGDIFVFGGITGNMNILSLPKIDINSQEVTTSLSTYIESTSKECYNYLSNMTGINAILDEISEKSDDKSHVSNDKIKLEESVINYKKPLVEEKKSGKFSLGSKKTEKTKSSKNSSKKSANWAQDYEVNEK